MKLFVLLHHSADPRPVPQFSSIDGHHMRRGFPRSLLGYHVGYHWFIGFDGTVKQARLEHEVGAHCPAKLMNYVGIGICLAGDFTQHQPDPKQIKVLAQLVSDIQTRWPIPDENILLHSECKATTCPGTDLRALLLVEKANLRAKKISNLQKAQGHAHGPRLTRVQRLLTRLLRP